MDVKNENDLHYQCDSIIFRNLFEHLHSSEGDFFSALCDTILELKPIHSVSFYSHLSSTDVFSLRAVSGVNIDDYDNITIQTDEIGCKAVSEKEIQVIEDVSKSDMYVNSSLVEKYSFKSMLCIPINIPEEMACRHDSDVYGILCIYPKYDNDINHLTNYFEMSRNSLSHSIMAWVNLEKTKIQSTMTHAMLSSTDNNSLLHKSLSLLKNDKRVIAGSIFLYDDRSETLRLAATTGLKDANMKKEDVFYRLDESNRTVRTFKECAVNTHIWQKGESVNLRYLEKIEGSRKVTIYLPIYFIEKGASGSESTKNRSAIGVLRLVNRDVTIKGKNYQSCFGWEDLNLFTFVAEFWSIQIYARKTVTQHGYTVEKALHGVHSNIMGVLGNLELLERRANVQATIDPSFKYAIPDSISMLEAINRQLSMFGTKIEDIGSENEKVLLAGEVVSKLYEFAKMIKLSYGIDKLNLNVDSILNKNEIGDLPPVQGSAKLYLNVLKNIIENSIKYSKVEEMCSIDFEWERDEEYLIIYIHDNGIGVPADETEYIFREGYQAINGRELRTSGTGIGLYQCKAMMQAMGGDIEVIKSEPLGMKLTLKLWRDN